MKKLIAITLTAALIVASTLPALGLIVKGPSEPEPLPQMRGVFMWTTVWDNLDDSRPETANYRTNIEIYPSSTGPGWVWIEIYWGGDPTTRTEARVLYGNGLIYLVFSGTEAFGSITLFPLERDSDGWMLATGKLDLSNVGLKGEDGKSVMLWGKATTE